MINTACPACENRVYILDLPDFRMDASFTFLIPEHQWRNLITIAQQLIAKHLDMVHTCTYNDDLL